MKKYTPPKKEFFMLPNKIFDMPLDAYTFKIYAYLVCCAGSRGECWPTMNKMSKKAGDRDKYGAGSDQPSGEAKADLHPQAFRQWEVQKQCVHPALHGQSRYLP